jgi:hypothetical protein
MDFAIFLQEHVCQKDLVYMKMNVEGAEYSVVKHLIQRNPLCLVDHLDIYWHQWIYPSVRKKEKGSRLIDLARLCFDVICGSESHVWSVRDDA